VERRRTSPSDALVDRARAGARDPDTSTADFRPTSPADAYFEQLVPTGDDVPPDPQERGPRGPAHGSGGDVGPGTPPPPRDATAIAEELLDVRDVVGPADGSSSPQESERDVASPSRALPDWANGEARGMSSPEVGPSDATSDAGGSTDSEDPGGAATAVLLEGDRWSTSTSEWERREAKRRVRQGRRLGVRLPFLRAAAALVAAGFVAMGFLGAVLDERVPIGDAVVGDCFDVGEELEVEQVEVVDCSEVHDSELFARIDFVPAFGTVHPGDDDLFEWLWDQCLERFPGYTGETYEDSRYWIDMLIPTPEGWSNGDHIGMCNLVVVDEDLAVVPTTGSGRTPGDSA
jgi:hypothetical protein